MGQFDSGLLPKQRGCRGGGGGHKASRSQNCANLEAFAQGMLEFRNSPRENELSPAEMVFGHQLQSIVPAHRSSFATQWQKVIEATGRQAELDGAIKFRYDEHARPFGPLSVGTAVRVRDPKSKLWDKVGVIVAIGWYRSYHIKFASGSVLWSILSVTDSNNGPIVSVSFTLWPRLCVRCPYYCVCSVFPTSAPAFVYSLIFVCVKRFAARCPSSPLGTGCCVRGNVSCNRQGLLAGEGSRLGLEAVSSRTICVLTRNTITIAFGDRTQT